MRTGTVLHIHGVDECWQVSANDVWFLRTVMRTVFLYPSGVPASRQSSSTSRMVWTVSSSSDGFSKLNPASCTIRLVEPQVTTQSACRLVEQRIGGAGNNDNDLKGIVSGEHGSGLERHGLAALNIADHQSLFPMASGGCGIAIPLARMEMAAITHALATALAELPRPENLWFPVLRSASSRRHQHSSEIGSTIIGVSSGMDVCLVVLWL